MAKKFLSGICAHCGQHSEKLTSDHVFPQSWYPDTTPEGIEKWQMPSCLACNQRYSKIENDLLVRLSLGLTPNDFNSLGVTNRGMRAISPKYGKNDKDRAHRKAKREKILKDIRSASEFNDKSFIPGLDNKFGRSKSELLAMMIPANDLETLAKKLVRGLTYVVKNKILDDSFVIEIIVVQNGFNPPELDYIRKLSLKYERGPGIEIAMGTPADNPDCGFFEIKIWGRIHFFGAVLPKIRNRS